MKIKWSPILSKNKSDYSQPEKDVISFGGNQYAFTDKNIVKYDVSGIPEFITAERIDGELYIKIKYYYTERQKKLWESQKNGGYPGENYINYGGMINLNEILY